MIRDAGEPAASESGLLRVEDVVKRFGGVTALDGLTLSLGAGESLGVMGPNGCGKTTLLDVISGFVRPDLGHVWLGGRDITRWPPHRVVRAGIARTFQPPRLPVQMTVEETLEAATLHRRLWRSGRRRTLNQILQITGLTDLRKRDVSTLSPGEIRRVQVGHALATGGRLLLLDEPFASVSAGDAPELLSLLRRLRSDGLSMLLVAHSAALFQALCDRVAVIAAGRVVRVGTPAEVLHA